MLCRVEINDLAPGSYILVVSAEAGRCMFFWALAILSSSCDGVSLLVLSDGL